ncbi:MAG: sirohydrochlorin cobaltochelatase [Candidatus Methanomethylophilaceae archaeon]|nr:sirohydrochlorin cobaltochelatase [Candidatus Methanomethylophilaceae archaeon]
MTKKAILIISFGTSYKETRDRTIGAVEKAVSQKYPDWEVRRAFTSKMIIKKLKERDNIEIDYIDSALQRMLDDGVKEAVMLSTHVMNGTEYDFVREITAKYAGGFDSIRISSPLLTTEEDYDDVISAMDESYFKRFFQGSTGGKAIVFMGHGTEHYANSAYCQLQMKLVSLGYEHVYITTVEGFPNFDDTMRFMAGHKYSKIVLVPFMLVAGDHATNDMAGDEEDSLKSKFISAGCEVECVLEGLGEQKAFQDLFLKHLADTLSE